MRRTPSKKLISPQSLERFAYSNFPLVGAKLASAPIDELPSDEALLTKWEKKPG